MIAVLNTGLANAASVLNAIKRLGYFAVLTQDPEEISQSSRFILPGVGSASAFMDYIQSRELQDCLCELKQPVLGICLGLQAFYSHSSEGDVKCLGIFPGSVLRLQPKEGFPIPHMGWNQVNATKDSRLLKNIPKGAHFYFTHSFRVPSGAETVAFSQYGEEIPAVVEASNWFGTQFHPERSGALGERLLKNFFEM